MHDTIPANNSDSSYFNRGKIIMAFVNEYISKEDIEKYQLDELEKKYNLLIYAWTIDREHNFFLIHKGRGRDEESQMNFFFFYRKGEISRHTIWRFVDRHSKTIDWKIQRYGEPKYESIEHEQYYEQLHDDLKDALRTYGLGGLVASNIEG
jgi:hypothetical protein